MFPPSFAQDAVAHLTRAGEPVLDPCCGRGNGPFTAALMGSPTVAIDINPVAWIFSAAKLQPAPDPEKVVARLNEVGHAIRAKDKRSRSAFETMVWAPEIRAFLKAARRELDWRESKIDRTLMAFIALHLQDKQNFGESFISLQGNQPAATCHLRRWLGRGGWSAPPL